MARKKSKKIPFVLYLTPEQIREAYQQLREMEQEEDWYYEPEVVREILARGREGRQELKKGETLSWEEVKSDLGV